MRLSQLWKRLSPAPVLEAPRSPFAQRVQLALGAALLVWLYEMVTYVLVWVVGGYQFRGIADWVMWRVVAILFMAAFFLLARSLRYAPGRAGRLALKHLALAVAYALVIRTVLHLLNWLGPPPDMPPVDPPLTFWEHMSVLRHWAAWADSLNEMMAGYILGLFIMFSADMLILYRSLERRTAELAAANRSLEEASLTDPLTGARNRRYLAQQLPGDIAYFRRQFARDPHLRMVFVQLDLDHFKQINDAYGHEAGDLALTEFTALVRRVIRGGDYLVRAGGEEFLVVLRSVPAPQVEAYCRRLYDAVRKFRFKASGGRSLGITCSIGVAEYPFVPAEPDVFDWEAVAKLADRAMYHAKQHGRNRWVLLRPGAGVKSTALRKELGRELETLVKKKHLVLVENARGRAPGRSPRVFG